MNFEPNKAYTCYERTNAAVSTTQFEVLGTARLLRTHPKTSPLPSPVQSFTGLSFRLAQPILISGLMFAYTIMKPYSDHLGRAKLFFALATPSPASGTALSLVTQSEDNGQFVVSYKFYSYNN